MEINDKLVIIPTYNERDNIERMVRKVMSLAERFHLLIIDDGSPDGTAPIVEKLQKEYTNRLFLVERRGKLGLGTAYIRGFRWAIEHKYSFIFEMDADFSHNPEDLLKLYETCKNGTDLAIGSRYISGVNVVNWPMGRVLMSYFASAYVRAITGMKIMDTTAGFKCYKKEVLESINLDAIKMKGYGFQIEMKFTAWKMGFKLTEVPIVFTERRVGTSKMSGGIFNEALWGVIGMKVKSWFKHYPKPIKKLE
jgi:dolichol-phosphate mannosyltransferase